MPNYLGIVEMIKLRCVLHSLMRFACDYIKFQQNYTIMCPPFEAHPVFDVNFINLCCVHDAVVHLDCVDTLDTSSSSSCYLQSGNGKFIQFMSHIMFNLVCRVNNQVLNLHNLLTQNVSCFHRTEMQSKRLLFADNYLSFHQQNRQNDRIIDGT